MLLIFSTGYGQQIDRYLAFGPSTASYKGDLDERYSQIGGGFNVMIVPERDKLIQTAIELNIGKVSGQQSGYYSENNPEQTPNTFFQTSFTSISFSLRAYLYRKHNVKVYIGQGIGAMRFVPKDQYGNRLMDSSSTRKVDQETQESRENYSNLSLILPRNLGVQYTLKNQIAVSLDVNQQANRTDYIDNISALGNNAKKDKVLLFRFSVMIPILYKKTEESETPDPS